MTPILATWLPLKLPSTANIHTHWRERASLVKSQRSAVGLALRDNGLRTPLSLLLVHVAAGRVLQVRLTRIAPRPIRDTFENLPMCLKAAVDQIAAELGVDDSKMDIKARQERGAYGLRIEVGVKQ